MKAHRLAIALSASALALASACSSLPPRWGVPEEPAVAPAGTQFGYVRDITLHTRDVFRVSVRFDDGREAIYDLQHVESLQVGDRVKYEGGQLYRV